jgi:hypothetical protein
MGSKRLPAHFVCNGRHGENTQRSGFCLALFGLKFPGGGHRLSVESRLLHMNKTRLAIAWSCAIGNRQLFEMYFPAGFPLRPLSSLRLKRNTQGHTWSRSCCVEVSSSSLEIVELVSVTHRA